MKTNLERRLRQVKRKYGIGQANKPFNQNVRKQLEDLYGVTNEDTMVIYSLSDVKEAVEKQLKIEAAKSKRQRDGTAATRKTRKYASGPHKKKPMANPRKPEPEEPKSTLDTFLET